MKKIGIVFIALFFVMLVAVSSYAGPERILARGDGVVVTGADVKAMKRIVGQSSTQPSPRSLMEGTLRIKLFAMEARNEGVDCPKAEAKSGFDQEMALANCHLRVRMAALTTSDEAVESYYRAYWRRFVNKKDGKLQGLDDDLRKKVRDIIVAAKKRNFGLQEYNRLCKKYDIIFASNGS